MSKNDSAKRNREDLNYWFENNVDLDSKTIYMGSNSSSEDGESGVDSKMAESFVKALHILESRFPLNDITVIMNNPGGEWYHGMAIYDAIFNSICKIKIIVYGHAMSMGSIILQSSSKRILMPNSRFMIHYGSHATAPGAHAKVSEKWIDEGRKINIEMENIYLDKMEEKLNKIGISKYSEYLTDIINNHELFDNLYKNSIYKLSKKYETRKRELKTALREMLNFDTILDANETVRIGFADKIFSKEI